MIGSNPIYRITKIYGGVLMLGLGILACLTFAAGSVALIAVMFCHKL